MKTVPKMLLCLARIAAILILLNYVQTTRKSDLTDIADITDITDITIDPQGILRMQVEDVGGRGKGASRRVVGAPSPALPLPGCAFSRYAGCGRNATRQGER